MVIHQCTDRDCGQIRINRIASDDETELILKVFEESQTLDSDLEKTLIDDGIELLTAKDERQIRVQLFGNRG